MSKVINDIPFSDMSHNSRVFKLHNRMKESQSRFSEAIKGRKSNFVFKGDDSDDSVISKKYDAYLDNLNKKRTPIVKEESLQEVAHKVREKEIIVKAFHIPIPVEIEEHILSKFNKYLSAFLECPSYNRQVIVSCPSPTTLKIEKLLNYSNPKKIGLTSELLSDGKLCKAFDWHFNLISIAKNIRKEDIRMMYIKRNGKLRLYLYVWSPLDINSVYSEYIQEVELFTNDFQILNPYFH
jgi:hypothetical protein